MKTAFQLKSTNTIKEKTVADLSQLKEAMNKVTEAQKELKKIKKQASTEAKSVLKQAFKEYFKQVPFVKAICWTQYTPYWNDGDTCEFDVYDTFFSTEEQEGVFYDEEDYIFQPYHSYKEEIKSMKELSKKYPDTESYKQLPILSEQEWNVSKDLFDMIGSIDKEIMEEMFGDHVYVLVTKAGIEVEEYEHD